MMDNTMKNCESKLEGAFPQEKERIQVKSQEEQVLQVKSGEERAEHQNKNSFKWTYSEHAKYVYFLQLNKAKIKSKLIRKSNAFFKQMERFLQTKTALQCRSHHQKFQERYKFPHRIITGQKKYIPIETYKSVIQQAKFTDFINNNQNGANNYISTVTHHPDKSNPKQYATISCQTEICDVNKQLHTEDQICQPVTFNYPFQTPELFMYYRPLPNFYSM